MKYLVSAGSNLSHSSKTPSDLVKFAHELLGNAFGTVKSSNYFANPAYPADFGPEFVNAVFSFSAQINPVEMLDFLHSIEVAIGRERKVRWGPRVIDLDLIAADDLVLPDIVVFKHWKNLSPKEQLQLVPKNLVLPHPRLQDRPFVLLPMREIAPDWQHPVTGLTVREMCDQLDRAAVASCTMIPG